LCLMDRERTSASQSADSCIVMIEDAIEEIDELTNHLKEGNKFCNVVIPKLDTLKQQVGDISARLTVERLEYDDRTRRASQELKDALMAKNLSSESNDDVGAERLECDDRAKRATQELKDASMANQLSSESNDDDGAERLECDDKAKRASQELKDALMANNLSSESNNGTAAIDPSASAQNNQRQSSDSNGLLLPPQQKNNRQTIGAAAHQTTTMSNIDDEKVATLVGMEFDPDKVVAALEKHNNNVDQALNELLSC